MSTVSAAARGRSEGAQRGGRSVAGVPGGGERDSRARRGSCLAANSQSPESGLVTGCVAPDLRSVLQRRNQRVKLKPLRRRIPGLYFHNIQ